MGKLFQTQCPLLGMLLIVCATSLCYGCNEGPYSTPTGYYMKKPKKMELGKVLNEISGISYNADSNTVRAISDSKGKVFELNLSRMKLRDVAEKFYQPADQPDYEDIVEVGKIFYILISDGTLLSVPAGAKDTSGTIIYPTPFTDKNDFETLYHDPSVNSLILICKSCAVDKGKKMRTAFRFDLGTKIMEQSPYYTMSIEKVREIVRKDDMDFKPSAAAIHPVNKRLYVLSSASNLLVVSDTRGQIIEAFHLNPDNFPQAEGIAFAPNGDMYVSNEGKYGKPTLLLFPYLHGKKK